MLNNTSHPVESETLGFLYEFVQVIASLPSADPLPELPSFGADGVSEFKQEFAVPAVIYPAGDYPRCRRVSNGFGSQGVGFGNHSRINE